MNEELLSIQFPIVGLSPMDGVTDSAFRQIVKSKSNPNIAFTEFVHVRALTEATENVIKMLDYRETERPIFAQIYGSDPQYFYHIAKLVVALGFDGVDINMGCPAKNVASSGAGAALIKTPIKALEIIKATKQGVEDWVRDGKLTGLSPKSLKTAQKQIEKNQQNFSKIQKNLPKISNGQKNLLGLRTLVPVTVKTRIGYDSIVTEKWIENLVKANPYWISIHGRTLKQMYNGEANWDELKKAVQISPIPIITNGDVKSFHDIERMLNFTGSSGVLVGRASFGNPWIFQDPKLLKEEIKNTKHAYEIIKNVMIEHTQIHVQSKPNPKEFVQMRKHFGWYCKTMQSWFNDLKQTRAKAGKFSSVKDLKIALMHVSSLEEVIEILS
ncbi:MAG: tRNA-dihydrouridine synthase [Candidatus Dojkabacteria bacterium]|nr:MAG: tRNA-dihydrouridine synthase [Candidatus Dojkabacteria bacterium]